MIKHIEGVLILSIDSSVQYSDVLNKLLDKMQNMAIENACLSKKCDELQNKIAYRNIIQSN
jgi:hypothetical protein